MAVLRNYIPDFMENVDHTPISKEERVNILKTIWGN